MEKGGTGVGFQCQCERSRGWECDWEGVRGDGRVRAGEEGGGTGVGFLCQCERDRCIRAREEGKRARAEGKGG